MKRAIDLIGASSALIVLSPVMAAVAIAVRASIGRPVLFAQARPGLRGNVFRLYKFRTMTDAREVNGAILPDELRLTPVGTALRRWSLDELPELVNVLKGDMSLVGPRPLRVEYLDRYSPRQARRHEVKPGITGWAQVCGRNALTWEDRFDLDLWYVDHRSLKLDLRILGLTIVNVLRREGISHAGHATMPEFSGSSGSETTPSPAEPVAGRAADLT